VFAEQLGRTDAIIRRVAPPRWMRPGAGTFAAFMRAPIDALGYRGVLGTIYPFDPQLPLRWFMIDVVLAAAHPGGIIILHDGPARGQRTADALDQILPRLRADGYRVVSLTELERSSTGSEPR
jgi:peptidoglycan-N-acetylglucosamine deacetylase